ncbi:transposase [Paenibacillus larvae]|nr:transposase [Paenibacillus larvae]
MADSLFPFVLVDAMYLKVREDGRVRSRGIMIAIGVNTEGYREVLGLMLGDTESEASWSEFFSSLKGRGLRGVDLITRRSWRPCTRGTAAAARGNMAAMPDSLHAKWLEASPKALKDEIHGRLRSILDAPDTGTARFLLNRP